MKNRTRNDRNSGFTLVEMLATVGILVILLAVVAVSVARHIDVLEIAERDNAARDIYMAVENRAVLLSGAERLDDLVPQEDPASPVALGSKTATNYTYLHNVSNLKEVHANPNEKLYFVHGEGIDKELLVTGGVDPTLLDGDFYIVYDLASGSVTDVFYAKEAGALEALIEQFAADDVDAFAKFYGFWADDRSNRLSLKNSEHNSDKTLVGWYNGEAAESGNFKRDTSVKPFLEVMIDNREKLTVTVTARGEYVDYISALEVWLGPVPLLDSEGKPYPLNDANAISLMGLPYEPDSSESDAYSCTWVLDSLIPSETQFKELVERNPGVFGGKFTLGDDFMVMATITHNSETASAWDVDNSLYQEGSQNDDHVAYIRYLRHLQNLDAENGHNSGVKDNITAAFQTADIMVYHNETYPEYSFVPIYNTNLTAYDGFGCEIHRLNVDLVGNGRAYSSDTNQNSLGLFRETPAGGMAFRNIRLVNATVKAAGSGASVGALAGKTFGTTTIDNCWVYWEANGYVAAPLKNTLGSDESGIEEYYYQLVGDCVGGLVGTANEKAVIQNSLAATLINGTSVAGGLVGVWNVSDHNADYDISCSYADCYLTGNGNAAGLIGNVKTTVDLKNCYSAGFIVGVSKKGTAGLRAAGLCLGSGKTTTQYVYTVMQYLDAGLDDIDDEDENGTNQHQIFYLTENNNDTFHAPTHYLGYDEVHYDKSGEGQVQERLHSHYSEMTSRVDSDETQNFADVMNGESGEGKFDWKDMTDSFPYNLRKTLALSVYSYPGLEGIPHYGDWGAEFKDPSLVYYEYYGDNTWGISGGNARNLNAFDTLSKDEGVSILSDGYAVAFLSDEVEDCTGSDKVAIKLTYSVLKNGSITVKDEEVSVSVSDLENRRTSWSDHVVYLIPLPDHLVYGDYARDCFYWFLKFEMYLPGEEENAHAAGEFFYNPHFAETVSPYVVSNADEENPKGLLEQYQELYGEGYVKQIEAYADVLARNMGVVKVRTPRHLYDLSQFMEYYSQSRYTFYQELNLNYGTYDWRMMNNKEQHIIADKPALNAATGTLASPPYQQDPIGSTSINFYGTYDGGSHVIKNVFPKVNLTRTNPYVGLFGYSAGRLQNIVYEMSPNGYAPDDRKDYTLTAGVENIAGDLYIGTLAGCNIGVINNCAVYGVSTDVEAPGVQMYIGGLVGLNNGTIANSAAECAKLAANSYSSGYLYIGGFVGRNIAAISTSYAVGRITVDASQGGESDLCGFAGSNSVAITDSYAAMYLESSGTGVTRYNFCKDYMDAANYFLDQGSFSYREKDYAANYRDEAASTTYAMLTGGLELETVNGTVVIKHTAANPVSGMRWVADAAHSPQRTNSVDEPYYPYPTAVTDGKGNPIHYGQWPGAVPMGDFGVLYWEKLQAVGDPNTYTYHFDALTVDAANGTITERSTLVTSHDDGKVVVAYGYGYYYAKTVDDNGNEITDFAPDFSAKGLGYFVFTPDVLTTPATTKTQWSGRIDPIAATGTYYGVEASDGKYTGGQLVTSRTLSVKSISSSGQALLWNNGQSSADFAAVNRNEYNKTVGSSAGLAEVIPGDFTVISWDSYREGGRPAEWAKSEDSKWSGTVDYGTNLSNYQSARKAASTAGLVPDYDNATKTGSWATVADGTFILSQTSGSNTVTVEFIVDPHFAGALSVKTVNGRQDTAKAWAKGNTKLTAVPGSKGNPFQIRNGSQLQEINTSTSFYTDFCIGMGGPFATAGEKYWDLPTAAQFPYLSSLNFYTDRTKDTLYHITNNRTGKLGAVIEKDHTYYRYFYFEQTHDIDWTAEGNTYDGGKPGVFTPIAAAAGRIAQNVMNLVDMPGWFAGSYDGQNYTIKNLHIDINSNEFNTSCIGLFGAVYNNRATVSTFDQTRLTNIVLYSETGEEEVIVRGRKAGNSQEPGGGAYSCTVRWYAGGCLVGAALGGCDISNCAVAGYTIIDQTRTGADNAGYMGLRNGSQTGSYVFAYRYNNNSSNPRYYYQHNGSFKHYGPSGAVVSQTKTVATNNNGISTVTDTGLRLGMIGRNVYNTGNLTSTDNGYSSLMNTTGEVLAGTIGGLVGLTDGNLNGCAAVTTIIMRPNHIDINKDVTTANDPDIAALPEGRTDLKHAEAILLFVDNGEGSPVRAGGLVGSTIGSVTNCYTGGEIQVVLKSSGASGKLDDMYATHCALNIGRIVGGVGAGVFKEKSGTTSATVSNCYSYMKMPEDKLTFFYSTGSQGWYVGHNTNGNHSDTGYTAGGYTNTDQFIFTRYSIGGKGPGGPNSDGGTGSTEISQRNNYYLTGTGSFTNAPAASTSTSPSKGVAAADVTGSVEGISYQRMASDAFLTSLGTSFKRVTTTVGADEVTVTGRFSYTPLNRLDLQDRNYPFPTVLKRPHNGQTVNVHYGAWPNRGIRRDEGGKPIYLDMFTGLENAVGGYWDPGHYEETLGLEGISGGTWSVEADKVSDSDENEIDVVTVNIGQDGKLTVDAMRDIPTPVTTTITVKYTVAGEEPYELKIPVNITAEVSLNESTVSLYPYDTVTMELTPTPDRQTNAARRDYGYKLTIDDIVYVSSQLNDVSGTNDEDGKGYITLIRAGEMSSNKVWVDVTYSYTQYYDEGKTLSHTETGSHRIEVTFLDLPENGLWSTNDSGQLIWTLDFSERGLEPGGQIQDARILNAGNDMPANSFGAEISGAQFILTLKNDFKIPSDIDVGFTVLMDDGLEHRLVITVPKPITEAELEEKLTPVEDDSGEDQPEKTGKSWTIDLTEYKDGLTTVERAEGTEEADGVKVVLDNGIVTITWDGTGEEPTEVKLKMELTKGDLVQNCVLTVSLSKESDGPASGSSEIEALPPEGDGPEFPDPEDKPDKKDPTGNDDEDLDEEEPDEAGDGKKENNEEENSEKENHEEEDDE